MTAVTFTPDGRFLVAASQQGWVRLWSTETWTPVGLKLPAETDEVLSLSVSPDSRILATGGSDGSVRLLPRMHGRRATPDPRRMGRRAPGRVYAPACGP